MTGNQDIPLRPLKHEALWPKELFEQGIGWVIVARFKSAGQRVEVGIFLVEEGGPGFWRIKRGAMCPAIRLWA